MARLGLSLLAVALLTVATSGVAITQSSDDLGGTSWEADQLLDVECYLTVTFHADGTATVDITDIHPAWEAHWTMDGDKLHLTYDRYYGGIDGTRSSTDRRHIDGTETTRDKDTKEVQTVPCNLDESRS